jgi:hypothetical protein
VKNHACQVDIGRSCGQHWGSIHGGLPVVGVRALVRFQPGASVAPVAGATKFMLSRSSLSHKGS